MTYELQLDVSCKKCEHVEKCYVGAYENRERFKVGDSFVGRCSKCKHKQLLIKKVYVFTVKKLNIQQNK